MGGKTQSKMCMVALQKQFDFSILNSTSPFFLSIHHFGMCLYPGYYHNAVYFCPLHKHKSTLNPLINCESINYNIFISTYDFVLFRLQQTNWLYTDRNFVDNFLKVVIYLALVANI